MVVLEGKSKKSSTISNEDWNILDRKALDNIYLCLAQLVAFYISTRKKIEELMKTLEKIYENIFT
jgi:hypothetical protein